MGHTLLLKGRNFAGLTFANLNFKIDFTDETEKVLNFVARN